MHGVPSPVSIDMQRAWWRRPWVMTMVSACLATAAFPPLDLGPLICVAFIPWLWALREFRSGAQALVSGLLVGMCIFLVDMFYISQMDGGAGSALWMYGMWAVVALVGAVPYLLFVPVARWCMRRLRPAWWLVMLPLLWVGVEVLRYTFPAPFPLLKLGYALHQVSALTQIAEIGGVHVVSALVVVVNVGVLVVLGAHRRGERTLKLGAGGAVCVLLGVATTWGLVRVGDIRKAMHPDGPRIAVVQPNIPQSIKLNIRSSQERWQAHAALSEHALREKPDLLVWSETSYPLIVYDGLELSERAKTAGFPDPKEFARTSATPLVVGTQTWLSDAEMGRYAYLSPQEREATTFNTAWFIDAHGKVAGRFDKIHLVAGGEYIPFRGSVLGDVVADYSRELAGYVAMLVPGYRYDTFVLKDKRERDWRFSMNICYEFAFPGLFARLHDARYGNVHFALTLSNEGWYFDSAELDQALICNQFRAIESRTTFVRATNTGISAVIDPTGMVVDRLTAQGKDKLVAGVLVSDLPCMAEPTSTVYADYGHAVVMVVGPVAFFGVLLWMLIVGVGKWVAARRSKRHTST